MLVHLEPKPPSLAAFELQHYRSSRLALNLIRNLSAHLPHVRGTGETCAGQSITGVEMTCSTLSWSTWCQLLCIDFAVGDGIFAFAVDEASDRSIRAYVRVNDKVASLNVHVEAPTLLSVR